nr:hypothetical protein [Tanacetum cinerariifolium]
LTASIAQASALPADEATLEIAKGLDATGWAARTHGARRDSWL